MTKPTFENTPASEATLKWGNVLSAGFQILPDALIRGQHLLKLTSTDIVVIANINQAWWYEDRRPYLTPHTIARRMGLSERSVQRSLSRLRDRGFLQQRREKKSDGTVLYTHDLSGLRQALEPLARRDMKYSATLRAQLSTARDEIADIEFQA